MRPEGTHMMKLRLTVNGTDYLVIEHVTGETRLFHRITRKWSGAVPTRDAALVVAAYEAHKASLPGDRELIKL